MNRSGLLARGINNLLCNATVQVVVAVVCLIIAVLIPMFMPTVPFMVGSFYTFLKVLSWILIVLTGVGLAGSLMGTSPFCNLLNTFVGSGSDYSNYSNYSGSYQPYASTYGSGTYGGGTSSPIVMEGAESEF